MIKHLGISPARPGATALPYTPAVRAGDFVFVSGQLGLDAEGKLVGADVGSQARKCIERIRALLQEAGSDLSRVIKVTVWLTDGADFAAYNEVYRELMPTPPPARSTVVSALVIPGAKIEIEAIAYVGS
jgi:2-iminobutanoate/2-iminopropanoate deaminase